MKRDFRELASNPRPGEGTETIAAVIGRYRRSGLSLQAFARTEGLPPGRLHYWIYQKHRRSVAADKPRGSNWAVAPAFQEVRLAQSLSLVTSWAAEVSLPTGVAVRFSATTPPAWVGAVVHALERPC